MIQRLPTTFPRARRALAAGLTAGALIAALAPTPAGAATGKLLLTGGVSSIDGAAGGGLTPWAVTGSYAARGQWGATAHLTRAVTQDYALSVQGVALSWDDRLELSLARQEFDARDNLAPLGLPGLRLKQEILGIKWRIFGDAVLDTDRWWPQVAVGLLHKRANPGGLGPTLTGPLGARDSGTEGYLSATKLLLARGLLLNATLRATRANQNGLLGFGGAESDDLSVYPEVSAAWLLRRNLALGAEYRANPDHLRRSVLGSGALAEDDWWDVFVAWAPNKHLSFTLAWVDLGHIAPAVQPGRQSGAYLSAQVAY